MGCGLGKENGGGKRLKTPRNARSGTHIPDPQVNGDRFSQGNPATVFCKASVRRSKYFLD